MAGGGPSVGRPRDPTRWIVPGIVAACVVWAMLGDRPLPEGVCAVRTGGNLLAEIFGGLSGDAVYAVLSADERVAALSEEELPAGPLVERSGEVAVLVSNGVVGLRVLPGTRGQDAFGRVERDRYAEVDWGGTPWAASSAGEDSWVAVLGEEALDAVLFDGRRVRGRARLLGSRPDAVALTAGGDGVAHTAVVEGGRVREWVVRRGEPPTAQETFSAAPPDGRAVAVRYLGGPSGARLHVLVRSDEGFHLDVLERGVDGPELVPAASFGEATDVRLLGAVPGVEGDHLLLRVDGRTWRYDGTEVRRSVCAWLTVWTSRHSLFLEPFLALLVAFGLGGALLGRRRGAWVKVGADGRQEAVRVVFPRSPLWRRFAAFVIDAALLLPTGAALAWSRLGPDELAYLEQALVRPERWAADPVATSLAADMSLLGVSVLLGYAAVCETFFGATLGKRLLGLRVLGLLGQPVGPGQALTRAAFLFVEVFLTQGWLAALLVVLTPRRRRLGDLFAGTQVVYFAAPGGPSVEPLDGGSGGGR